MGYDCHHAIIVTGAVYERMLAAHVRARAIFPLVSELLPHVINGGCTFLIPPDGSQEGWDDSDEGDKRRAEFIAWLNTQRFEDGGSPYDWVEVQYGDDNGDYRLLHTDQDLYGTPGVIKWSDEL